MALFSLTLKAQPRSVSPSCLSPSLPLFCTPKRAFLRSTPRYVDWLLQRLPEEVFQLNKVGSADAAKVAATYPTSFLIVERKLSSAAATLAASEQHPHMFKKGEGGGEGKGLQQQVRYILRRYHNC